MDTMTEKAENEGDDPAGGNVQIKTAKCSGLGKSYKRKYYLAFWRWRANAAGAGRLNTQNNV